MHWLPSGELIFKQEMQLTPKPRLLLCHDYVPPHLFRRDDDFDDFDDFDDEYDDEFANYEKKFNPESADDY